VDRAQERMGKQVDEIKEGVHEATKPVKEKLPK
jgi:hypothetical protein